MARVLCVNAYLMRPTSHWFGFDQGSSSVTLNNPEIGQASTSFCRHSNNTLA
jgi:hypothetical protein